MDDRRRARLFWSVCIPVRLAIAGGALALGYGAPRLLPALGAVAAAVAIGFVTQIVRAACGWKTHGGFGGRVWWTRMRYLHAAAWAAAAVLGLLRLPYAGAPLLADALAGALAGAWRHRVTAARRPR